MATVLIVDDEERITKILSMQLRELGHDCRAATSGEQALRMLDEGLPDVVITDMRMGAVTGQDVIKAARHSNPDMPVIVLTAFGSFENAVEAMRDGATDYLTKPWSEEDLRQAVERALQLRRLRSENAFLRAQLRQQRGFETMVGRSPAMQRVFDLIERVAATDSTVLILGESGTGKELAAYAIHERSERRDGPMVPINCIAVPEELLESELFGHVRGAFTGADRPRMGKFELAHRGTLFLDEIGDMSPRLQGKLLRALQERTIQPVGSNDTKHIDVRIIAATNANLEERVRVGAFRQDLYYRLTVVPITMPPLREREGDIPLLIEHFLRQKSCGRPPIVVPPAEVERLCRYPWPGNVRELQNIVERAVVLGVGELSKLMGLDAAPPSPPPSAAAPAVELEKLRNTSYRDAKLAVLSRFEHDYFSDLLRRTGGNVSQAAELADMHRKNLHVKLQELGLDPRDFAPSRAGVS